MYPLFRKSPTSEHSNIPSRWPQCFTAVLKKNENDPNGKTWDYMGLYGIIMFPMGNPLLDVFFNMCFCVSEVSNKFLKRLQVMGCKSSANGHRLMELCL